MGVKMNLRIITKNHAADPEKGFLIKSISKPYGRATAMPTAWELIKKYFFNDSDTREFIFRQPILFRNFHGATFFNF